MRHNRYTQYNRRFEETSLSSPPCKILVPRLRGSAWERNAPEALPGLCNPLGFCDSPRMAEGAKLIGMGRMWRNRLFGPFRAMGVARGCEPRAALRFALGCYL